jgi:ubiquinone/menaquinone biosynthesis C-methylase UbiE
MDASEALIAIARERVPQGDFRVGDLEALPYSKKAFDAIVAALSVQYAADPVVALRELKRICDSSGYFVITESNVVDCPFEYPDLETHWQAQRSAGPLQAALRVVDEAQLRAEVEQAIEPYRTSTGGVQLQNRFRYVTATV